MTPKDDSSGRHEPEKVGFKVVLIRKLKGVIDIKWDKIEPNNLQNAIERGR